MLASERLCKDLPTADHDHNRTLPWNGFDRFCAMYDTAHMLGASLVIETCMPLIEVSSNVHAMANV